MATSLSSRLSARTPVRARLNLLDTNGSLNLKSLFEDEGGHSAGPTSPTLEAAADQTDLMPSPVFINRVLSENSKLREKEVLLARVSAEADALRDALKNILGVVAQKDAELGRVKRELNQVLSSPTLSSSFPTPAGINWV